MTSGQGIVTVPVTNIWRAPDAVRPVDTPSTTATPDIPAWLAALDRQLRLDLVDRVVTQALLGETVTIIDEFGPWAQVELPAQPSRHGVGGYRGWVPAAHLLEAPASTDGDQATITARLAPATSGGDRLGLSCGTHLPVEVVATEAVTLRAPDGRLLDVAPWAIEPVLATGHGVLRTARRWNGLPYIWGGCSGYGVDCSGLVHLAHRAAGLVIPRDADDQATGGTRLPAGDAQPGDLWFFARPGEEPHHVGLCAGAGWMLHSPRTGRPVEEITASIAPYEDERLPHARRYSGEAAQP